MKIIALHDIHMDSPFDIHRILDIHLHAAVNAHATCSIECVLQSDESPPLSEMLAHVPIKLYDNDSVLFAGYLLRASETKRNDSVILNMHCVGSSYLMDVEEHKRSYQDKSRTFGELAGQAVALSGLGYVEVFEKDRATSKTIIQYRESDWEFALRLAGQLHSVLTPNIQSIDPQVGIGFPSGESYTISEIEHSVVADNRYTIRNKRISVDEFSNTVTIATNAVLMMGDRVRTNGRDLIVGGVDIRFAQSISNGRYILGNPESFQITPYHNRKLLGAAFSGTMIDVKPTMVKVHLDIDREQPVETACWFDFVPMTCYALYAMPQIGQRIQMQMASDDDDSGLVVSCMRSVDIKGYADATIIHRMQNDFKKRLTHNKDQISFDTNGEIHRWKLQVPNIEIDSALDIRFSAKRSILFNAANQVVIAAPSEIQIQSTTHRSGVEISGALIQLEAYEILEQSHAGETIPDIVEGATPPNIPEPVINQIAGTHRII